MPSGVYTEPVYYALAELDFTEVMVISPEHGFCTRRESPQSREDYLMRQLQKLRPGCVITITPAEAA